MKLIIPCAILFLHLGATAGDKALETEVKRLSDRQDSILKILSRIEDQTKFVALRVGWQPPEDTLPKAIPEDGSPWTGAKKPVLTVVEFTDFQCPYCAQSAPVLDSLVRAYPGKVRLVFKHFPLSFHQQAISAHLAALAAGKQGKFYEYRFKLAPRYSQLNDDVYMAVARELGLDTAAFRRDMMPSPEAQAAIDGDIALGRKLGVSGTPTMFANGIKMQDRSFEGYVEMLKKAGRR